MTDQPHDLAAQVAALTERMNALETAQRADITRTLGNHGRLISGWGEQLNGRIDRLDAEMRGELDDLRTEMRAGFGDLATGMAHITTLLTPKNPPQD